MRSQYSNELSRCAIMTIVSEVKRTHAEMIDILAQAKGIQYIEEL